MVGGNARDGRPQQAVPDARGRRHPWWRKARGRGEKPNKPRRSTRRGAARDVIVNVYRHPVPGAGQGQGSRGVCPGVVGRGSSVQTVLLSRV